MANNNTLMDERMSKHERTTTDQHQSSMGTSSQNIDSPISLIAREETNDRSCKPNPRRRNQVPSTARNTREASSDLTLGEKALESTKSENKEKELLVYPS